MFYTRNESVAFWGQNNVLLLLEMGGGKKIQTKEFQNVPKFTDFPPPSFAVFEQPLQFGSYLDKWLTFGIFQLSLISQKDAWTNANTLARVWYLQPENFTSVTQFYCKSQDTTNINALCPLAQGISISQFLKRLLLTIYECIEIQTADTAQNYSEQIPTGGS